MRFGAHQTFHLRSSWLHKGLLAISDAPNALHRDNAIEKLGLGKNMVESLRYWLEATRLAEREDGEMFMTQEAEDMFHYDPFFELDGTLQTVHYLLASNEESATVWHWFFNKFSASEFDADSLGIYLESYVSTNCSKKIQKTTLVKDVNCLLRMYRAEDYGHKSDPETSSPSPFSKFRRLEQKDGRYSKRELNSVEVSPLIFVFSLYLFWERNLQSVESISIEDIANKEGSPGLIFGLSLEQCIEVIEIIFRKYADKYLQYNKTGGYFIVNLNSRNAKQALKNYYKENQMVVV